jgi:hypothetical protein
MSKTTQHRARNGRCSRFLNASHRHTKMRSFHDDSHTSRSDSLHDSQRHLFRQPLLYLKSTSECFCDSSEFRKTENELVRDVSDGDLSWGKMFNFGCFKRGYESQLTRPVNGTMWCSQRLNTSMSLTITISSWSSANTASLITSKGRYPSSSVPNVSGIETP